MADDCAATLFMAGIAARAWGPVLWVVRRRDLFAPGLSQAGLDAQARCSMPRRADDAELLAVMEEGLRHRGLGAVIGEAKRADMTATRRLQLAAEGGRTIALLMKRHAARGRRSARRALGRGHALARRLRAFDAAAGGRRRAARAGSSSSSARRAAILSTRSGGMR